MPSWMHRTWVCDVERCPMYTHSAPVVGRHGDIVEITPSSYSPPAGWLVFRPWLHARRHATGRVILCPTHRDRGDRYRGEVAAWNAGRSAVCAGADWSTPAGRDEIHAKLDAWFAANPHPVVDLGGSTP